MSIINVFLIWIAVMLGSFMVIRLCVGRLFVTPTAQEAVAVFSGCVAFGLIPMILVSRLPGTETGDFFLALFVGTFLGAVCGELWWIFFGDR